MGFEGHAKIQHYVPQFLLKNFGSGKKNNVYVYDKIDSKVFKTNTRNIICESKFYDFEIDLAGQKILGTIESKLSEIEKNASIAIKKLIDSDNISVLDEIDKRNLSLFFSSQVARTKNSRINFELFSSQILLEMEKIGIPKEEIDKYTLDKNEKDLFFTKYVAAFSEEMAGLFYNKVWILGKNNSKIPFCIGDDPVVCHNDFIKDNDQIFNPHGFGVEGTSIYLPLSPLYVLYLFCPKKAEMIRDGLEKNKHLFDLQNTLNQNLETFKIITARKNFYDALVNNKPLLLDEEIVKHINSLEAIYSERYIILKDDDFQFIQTILDGSIQKHRGKRIIIG